MKHKTSGTKFENKLNGLKIFNLNEKIEISQIQETRLTHRYKFND